MPSGWERLATRSGGTVAGLATATSGDGTALVFAATSAGVFRSSNGGWTWAMPGDGSSVPFAEVVTPSSNFARDRTIFVCAGDGLYRSVDGGEAWHRVLVGSRMLSVAGWRGDEAEGVLLTGTDTDGILRSADDGRTWSGANAGLLDLTALALALSPQFGADRVGFAGTPSGLYRTRNGAGSWRAVETGLDEPAVQCLAVSPTFSQDHLVLAGTEADGLLRSDDAGTTWHRPPSLASGCVTALAFSARRTIAAATESSVAVSQDGGETWRTTGSGPASVLSLVFVEEADGEALLAGLHRRGILRSADGGATWSAANDGLSAGLLSGLILSPAFGRDRTLFSMSLEDGVSASVDGGWTWSERNRGLEDLAVTGLALSPRYVDDQTLFAATPAGIHVSRDAGASWQRSADGSAPARAVAVAPAPNGASPIVMVAISGGALLASDDGARTWHALGAGFDGAEIISIVTSPNYANDRTIFVTTRGSGEVVEWRSVDGGARWHRWLVEPSAQDMLPVAVSPNYAVDELVFVGLDGRLLEPMRHVREVRSGERRPVWRSVDFGGGGLAFIALQASPGFAQDRTLFGATHAGVFVSRDGGETFQGWSDGLVQPRIAALAVSPSYPDDRLVFALSLGGTIWRRRDDLAAD